jgi:hypothetical protein
MVRDRPNKVPTSSRRQKHLTKHGHPEHVHKLEG